MDIENQTVDYLQKKLNLHLHLPGGGGVDNGTGVCIESPPLCRNFINIKESNTKRKRNDFDNPITAAMNHHRRTTLPKLDLRLNLSPPRPFHDHSRRLSLDSTSSPNGSEYSISPPSSCLSSELSQEDLAPIPVQQLLLEDDGGPTSATSSMVLVGCPRCLMYVMLSEDDPKCPKCKSSVLLDFIGGGGGGGAINTFRAGAPGVAIGADGYGGGHSRIRK